MEFKRAKDVDPEAWVRVIPDARKAEIDKQSVARLAQIDKQIASLTTEKLSLASVTSFEVKPK